MRSDSETRFSLLEMDDGPVAGTASAPQPQYQPPRAGEYIDHDGADKARREREAVKAATGLDLSGKAGQGPGATFYDSGTVMLAAGRDTARQSRRDWEQRPTVDRAARDLAAIVEDECRRDLTVDLRDYRVDSDGYLTRPDPKTGRLEFTDWSFSQIRQSAPKSAKGTLSANLNGWLGRSATKRVIRTRYPNREERTRELTSAVSPKYAIYDGYQAIADLARVAPGNSRALVEYDPATTALRADVSLHNPYEVEDEITVGRVHRFGVRLKTDDRGGSRLKISGYVERIRCINCTIVGADWATIDRVHRGSARELIEASRDLFARAGQAMREFGEVWREASYAKAFSSVEGSETARVAFESLVDAGEIEVDGVSRDLLVERLVDAWGYEPGSSYQAIQRAITRSAHTAGWGWDQQEDLEEIAGHLLYNRVWEQHGALA